jgi:predicted O-linked N-acetylglucosamine transferase (SPINDLY family)
MRNTQVLSAGAQAATGTPDWLAHALGQAADGALSLPALIDIAAILQAGGAVAEADTLYRTWLAHAGQHPHAYAVRFNFAVSLADRGRTHQAKEMLLAALAQKPDFAPACINLGSLLEREDDRLGALAAWHRITDGLPQITGDAASYKTTAWNQIARVLETAKVEPPAEAAMRASLDIDPAQPQVIQHYVALRQAQCIWPALADLPRLSAAAQMRSISPLSLAAQIDDPVLQLARAFCYHRQDAQLDGIGVTGDWPAPADREPGPLRIGYVSSDMREHAVGYLTSPLFRLHDRRRVKIFAYYCGPAREDAMKAQFREDADHWRDISALSDRDAAALIVQDGIDILVDVNGYTKDGRLKLFALRPAPIIVNWLGFPGTLGSPHHHYILADATIIPPQDEIFYAERVLRLPCYQPNDPARRVASDGQNRTSAGLPDGAFVFCVFNGPHKITPAVFTIWMRILHGAPSSVLWLLCDAEETRARLRGQASEAGIDADRLVFAGRMGNAEHLARYRLADLFLDTAPYGAHTTASDALWMGVPVLTRAGNGFAARVCASLVREAGIPELVCQEWAQYEALALRLARTPDFLASLRDKLRAARDGCALFDTPRLVRALEDRFEQMWREHCAGALPRPKLDQLARYQRIGCEPDRPALPARDELLSWYDRALTYENAIRPMPFDALLWPREKTDSPMSRALAA